MERTRRGFTLLEMLIVLGIIALLAAVAAPNLIKVFGKSAVPVTKQQIGNTLTALSMFRNDVGRFPTTEEGLAALQEGKGIDRWAGPYLSKKGLPKDGWRNPLRYRCPANEPGREFEVFSYGSDDKEGGTGEAKDIYDWQEE
ncbi:MAG: type II secretion system major pseudopilin GspG [Phycisphaerales bacterium]